MADDHGPVITGPWKVRCTATNKFRGDQCKNWAVKGMAVCRFHGGGGRIGPGESKHNPRNAAADRRKLVMERLEEMAEEAAETVRSVMYDEGAKPESRLKAAELVLDRVVGRKIEHEQPQEELDLDSEIEQAMRERSQALEPTGTDGDEST